MSNLILQDTSLCAIVRDEKINPAGGIVDFVDCAMPFVESGVIVDTGSLDGTRELLEELAKKYSNLKIYDTKFKGYSHARNISLKKAKTQYALVLDADERLYKEDFEKLKNFMDEHELERYNLGCIDISPDGKERKSWCHNPRLFDNQKGYLFLRTKWEFLHDSIGQRFKENMPEESTNVSIKHFIPSIEELSIKRKNWYDERTWQFFLASNRAPSETEDFQAWKKRSPSRDNYHFGI